MRASTSPITARAPKSAIQYYPAARLRCGRGTVELFPQEITRAFLNLISNGFYAATKRKTRG